MLRSRPSGLVAGTMNVVRFFSRRALEQSSRAAISYSSRIEASPAAGSLPCGVAVTHVNAGRSRICERPSSVEMLPSRTPAQKAASLRPASRLAMLSGVEMTE